MYIVLDFKKEGAWSIFVNRKTFYLNPFRWGFVEQAIKKKIKKIAEEAYDLAIEQSKREGRSHAVGGTKGWEIVRKCNKLDLFVTWEMKPTWKEFFRLFKKIKEMEYEMHQMPKS